MLNYEKLMLNIKRFNSLIKKSGDQINLVTRCRKIKRFNGAFNCVFNLFFN
jgi:cell fate regulator YaaT (PSP1 superfamily)